MPALKKIQTVDRLVKLLQQSANVILVNIGKASHQSLEALRRQLKDRQAAFHIVKNSLLALAAKQAKLKEFADKTLIRGPSALLVLPADWSRTLSAAAQFIKVEGGAAFKIGLVDKVFYREVELVRLSQLPSREILLAKIAGALKSPSARLVYGMKFGMIKIVNIIKQIKGGEVK